MIMLAINVLTLVVLALLLFLIAWYRRSKNPDQQPTGASVSPADIAPRYRFQLSDLWRWDGTIDRTAYLILGLGLFSLKYNLDRALAAFVFHRSWSILDYYNPLDIPSLPPNTQQAIPNHIGSSDMQFFGAMLLLALPFIWTGFVLTIRRLRDIQLPSYWAFLFFVPFLNLLFFLLLSILPTRTTASEAPQTDAPKSRLCRMLDSIMPDNFLGSAIMGVLLTVPFAIGGILCSTTLGNYGWGLFLGIPFCVGLASVLLHGYHQERKFAECLLISALSIVVLGAAIFVLLMEGVICLAMAAPLGFALGLMGGALGYVLQRRPQHKKNDTMMILLTLVISLPLLMGAESKTHLKPALYAVESVMEIDAPPEVVWNNVVSFSQLPEPTEWVFNTGIAYPIRAEIKGRGVGAVRHCIFSTGEFVEPIEVWEEPYQLGFGVETMPMPMHEWSYQNIRPPHLEDYLQVHHGEFKLQRLPNNRTRLLGTTWYSNKVWPSEYWKLWSDSIIHTIHLRVLKHIKNLSEDVS